MTHSREEMREAAEECSHPLVPTAERYREVRSMRQALDELERVEVERDDFERKLEREEDMHHGCDKKHAAEIADLRAKVAELEDEINRAYRALHDDQDIDKALEILL